MTLGWMSKDSDGNPIDGYGMRGWKGETMKAKEANATDTADKVIACAFNLRHAEDKEKAAGALRIALAELEKEMEQDQ